MGSDEGSGPEGGGGARRKLKRQEGARAAPDLEGSGNRQCVACGATARSKCPSSAPACACTLPRRRPLAPRAVGSRLGFGCASEATRTPPASAARFAHPGTTQTPKWRCGLTLCNACGLRNAKRRCSGTVRARLPPPQAQPQAQAQPPESPQLALPAHHPAQLQQALPPQPYGQLYHDAHVLAGYPPTACPPPACPRVLLPPKAQRHPHAAKQTVTAEYPPSPRATPGLTLSDGAGSPQHHVTLAA